MYTQENHVCCSTYTFDENYIINMINQIMAYRLAQTSAESITTIGHHGPNRNKRISDKIYFLLCESCFWSASYLSTSYNIMKDPITHCPLCNTEKIESMPISDNEEYRFEYNMKQGIMLEFKKALW